jgi:hypothetical protein
VRLPPTLPGVDEEQAASDTGTPRAKSLGRPSLRYARSMPRNRGTIGKSRSLSPFPCRTRALQVDVLERQVDELGHPQPAEEPDTHQGIVPLATGQAVSLQLRLTGAVRCSAVCETTRLSEFHREPSASTVAHSGSAIHDSESHQPLDPSPRPE